MSEILEIYKDFKLLKADGFDNAILGVDQSNDPVRLIYSVKRCLDILEEDMSSEEAMEYFSFNIECAYMGEETPIWCWDV
jgi:hypothetical protein